MSKKERRGSIKFYLTVIFVMCSSVIAVNQITKQHAIDIEQSGSIEVDSNLIEFQGVDLDIPNKGWIVSRSVKVKSSGLFVLELVSSPCGRIEPHTTQLSGIKYETIGETIFVGSELTLIFEEEHTSKCEVVGDPRSFYGGLLIKEDCNLIQFCESLFEELNAT